MSILFESKLIQKMEKLEERAEAILQEGKYDLTPLKAAVIPDNIEAMQVKADKDAADAAKERAPVDNNPVVEDLGEAEEESEEPLVEAAQERTALSILSAIL